MNKNKLINRIVKMDSILASYTPLDLTTIQKALPKGLRKINTDKDLETEVQDI